MRQTYQAHRQHWVLLETAPGCRIDDAVCGNVDCVYLGVDKPAVDKGDVQEVEDGCLWGELEVKHTAGKEYSLALHSGGPEQCPQGYREPASRSGTVLVAVRRSKTQAALACFFQATVTWLSPEARSPAELHVHIDPSRKARHNRHSVTQVLLLVLKELLCLALQAKDEAGQSRMLQAQHASSLSVS